MITTCTISKKVETPRRSVFSSTALKCLWFRGTTIIPYMRNWFDETSYCFSILSGDSSGSTSSACFAITASSGRGRVIAMSLIVSNSMSKNQVEGKDMKTILWSKTVQSTILYHFFRVALFFHLLQLNSVLVLLLQLLHRLPHLSLLVASSARLLFRPTLRHNIVEAREDDEC